MQLTRTWLVGEEGVDWSVTTETDLFVVEVCRMYLGETSDPPKKKSKRHRIAHAVNMCYSLNGREILKNKKSTLHLSLINLIKLTASLAHGRINSSSYSRNQLQ